MATTQLWCSLAKPEKKWISNNSSNSTFAQRALQQEVRLSMNKLRLCSVCS